MLGAQTDLLKGLSEIEAGAVSALGQSLQVDAGHVLFRLAEPAERVFLVLRGRLTLTLPMQIRGREEDVLIEERLPGETLGWSGLIPPHRFTLNATAVTASELLAFERDKLLAHFAEYPEVGYRITRNVATVIGHRLGVFQTMWLRQMQRTVEMRYE